MSSNPYTYGTIRWAHEHVRRSPADCSPPKDCPDCAYAMREIEAESRADMRVLRQSTDDGQPRPTRPRRVL